MSKLFLTFPTGHKTFGLHNPAALFSKEWGPVTCRTDGCQAERSGNRPISSLAGKKKTTVLRSSTMQLLYTNRANRFLRIS